MQETPKKLISVAVTEDNDYYRNEITTRLNSFDDCIVLFTAEDGQQLLDQLSVAKTLPDIIFLDISMPVMNGYDALVAIKKRWPAQCVCMLTVWRDDYAMGRCIQSGTSGYIIKEYIHDELHDAVHDLCRDNAFFSREITDDILKRLKESNYPKITQREMEYLTWNCKDLSKEEMAKEMNVSVRTVDDYRESLVSKFGVKTRVGMAMFAIRNGLVELP